MAIVDRLAPDPSDPGPFGALLRRLRLQAGLSQNRLARLGGVDPAYVNRLERPRPSQAAWTPSRAVVLRLWAALDTVVEDRERLLVASGHCPEVIVRAGGWDAYLATIRQNVGAALAALDRSLTVPPDGRTDGWG